MLKIILAFILSLLVCQNVKAQQDTSVFFISKSGEFVADRTSADHYFVVLPPDSIEPNLFLVKGYYMDGKLMLITKSTVDAMPMHFQGPCITYFENGHKKFIANYENGGLQGDITFYYPDGKPYSIENYSSGLNEKHTLVECRDTSGNIICKNGEGDWIEYGIDLKNSSEGQVIKGLKNGEWKGQFEDSIIYTCIYKKGELVSGVGYGKDGKPHSFKKIIEEPKFGQGVDTFDSFIQYTKKYPAYAADHKISGGAVVSYTVQADGTVTDVKILSGHFPSLNAEALRVVSLSPVWIPGRLYGIPYPMTRTVSIYF